MKKLTVVHLVLLVGLLASLALGLAASGEPVGNNWQTEVVDGTDCWFPSLALDSNDKAGISYGAAGNLNYAHYEVATWVIDPVEDQPGATGSYSSLAFDSLDQPHISYYAPYNSSLIYAKIVGAMWQIAPVTATGDMAGRTALALDQSDRPRIAFWDPPNLAVKFAFDNGSGWQFQTIDNMVGSGQNVSLGMALDSADQPHVCYYDYDNGRLNYAHHDGGSWQIETVGEGIAYNGQDCSITVDSHDQPHISFRDLGLLYAHFDGTDWQVTTVDEDFFAGSGSSLALDTADRPHISYADWADVDQYDIRYAYGIGGTWWLDIVESVAGGLSFDQTSLALDSNGRARIAYWQVGNPDVLKYAYRDAPPNINQAFLPFVFGAPGP